MTEVPTKKKKTSSTSKPRNKTAPSMNSSASITNASSGSVSGKPKPLEESVKTSSLVAGTSKSKKGSAKGKFAFQGSRPKSTPSSEEVMGQERLFSLADLKELAQIVREVPASSGPKESNTARGTPASRPAKKTIAKAPVSFKKKNGQKVEFAGRAKGGKKASAAAPVAAPVVPQVEIEQDMPSLAGYQNPYSYAFT